MITTNTLVPIFCGMIFVLFDFILDSWKRAWLENLPHVHGFCRIGEGFMILKNNDIITIQRIEQKLGDRTVCPFVENDPVQVTEGPMSASNELKFIGLADGGGTAWLSSPLGRVSVPLRHVEPRLV